MTLREAIIEFAEREIGTTEFPAGSNRVKYNDWYYPVGHDYFRVSIPWHWCGTFVSYIYHYASQHLDVSNPLYDLPNRPNGVTELGFHYVPTFDNWAKKHGKTTLNPKEGDIVLFDWNKDGLEDHTGIFVKWHNSNQFWCIEGNTSDSNKGSQSNGGGVYLRLRHKSLVSSFVNVIDDEL